ncbi:type-F conjugative transfer system protein TraW [Caulobacter sp. 17J65-9]|uniref:type-F conjugative transfer system protein TraW n=1 Tax=Caulobacter sp. 17J65-9 TaxID=2709382 RepID=UPI001F09973B|nr:type-F conjugative transfer system protein TraW [Caulobacter sp. 17J65-9]
MATAIAAAGAAQAKDLGTIGHTFTIAETDILEYIAAKLRKAQQAGKLDSLQKEFTARVKKRVERPRAVDGLRTTVEPRSWLFDPTIIVPKDFSDPQGRVFARAGERLNPLDRLPGFDRVLIFINGDDPRQVEFAFKKLGQIGERRGRVVLVDGAPLELMRKRKRQVYFDQEGRLSGHFGLRQVPAIVEREGSRLRVSEVKP